MTERGDFKPIKYVFYMYVFFINQKDKILKAYFLISYYDYFLPYSFRKEGFYAIFFKDSDVKILRT